MSESHGDLDSVKASALFWESGDLSQVHEELTTTDEAHDEKDLLLRLENVAHAYKERMVGLQKDVFLQSS